MCDEIFSASSLTGFELELLAPPALGRVDLALALAERFKGSVQSGFKYSSEGLAQDGRPICNLTRAYKVVDALGQNLVTLVDDSTIRSQLRSDKNARPGDEKLRMNDLRLALWCERHCWIAHQSTTSVEQVAQKFVQIFDAAFDLPDDASREKLDGAGRSLALRDPWGQVLALREPDPGERHRVCEIVTRPLVRDERRSVIDLILQVAEELNFTVPLEASLHLHFDRAPWQNSERLCRLILGYSAQRESLMNALQPNRNARKLGPFSQTVLKVARECPADLPFGTLAAALSIAGVRKACDMNIKWVIEPYAPQPTLEFRALPMTMDTDALFKSVDQVEFFLQGVI